MAKRKQVNKLSQTSSIKALFKDDEIEEIAIFGTNIEYLNKMKVMFEQHTCWTIAIFDSERRCLNFFEAVLQYACNKGAREKLLAIKMPCERKRVSGAVFSDVYSVLMVPKTAISPEELTAILNCYMSQPSQIPKDEHDLFAMSDGYITSVTNVFINTIVARTPLYIPAPSVLDAIKKNILKNG